MRARVLLLHLGLVYGSTLSQIRSIESQYPEWEIRIAQLELLPGDADTSLDGTNWDLHSDEILRAEVVVLVTEVERHTRRACYRSITAINPNVQCGKWWVGAYNLDLGLVIEKLLRRVGRVVEQEQPQQLLLPVYIYRGNRLDISEANALLEPLGYRLSVEEV